MEFRQKTLDNGLEIVAECNPNAYSVGIAFFVKTGSRDETDQFSGVSHFLEHMVFKGTPQRTAADVNRELDEIGSHSNAYTSEEQTVYYGAVLPEYQDRAVDLLSDILRPSLRADDFEVEKKVILEEIAKYENQPPFGANEKCMAAHFSGHSLARNVLGSIESVGSLTPEQMMAYFQQRYSSRNIVLVASGNVDFDRLVAEANRRCGHWEPFEAPRDTSRPASQSVLELVHKESSAQEYVVQLADGPAAEDADRHAARILATVLGDDSGSRMFWNLIDTGLAEYAAVGAYEFQGTGVFMSFLGCAPERTQENLQRIHDLEVELESDGVTEAELAQAKNKICSHLVLQGERASNRMFSVGSDWIQRGSYRTLTEVREAYEAVEVDEIDAVLAKYPLTVNTTVAVGPCVDLIRPS